MSEPLRATPQLPVQFLPVVRDWFARTFGAPTEPQARGWPEIAAGRHTLIAAPTGSGKTLAAFLAALDALLAQGAELPDATQVLYVSPLRALSNDVQKNLAAPLAELRALDPSLPDVRALVRHGDTPARERAAMVRRPPHILVTTPESFALLLTSGGGRSMLAGVRTVIVDEIHAIAGDKRGAHLALSLERLEDLTGHPVQRIGLSATQRPLKAMARFLVGVGRECSVIDAGHLRHLDLALEVPPSPLETVCSQQVWSEIHDRIAELVRAHRTTLVFVNTRKLAERLAAALAPRLGADAVTCHHSSLSKERRLEAEQRLKAGRLQALVATASLELGIDIGDVDLVVQVGACRRIATFLQRVGRSGHSLGRIPRGRLFPLTRDELVEAVALLEATQAGELDRVPPPRAPLDVLGQQLVGWCVGEARSEEDLHARVRRAWPYRELTRAELRATLDLYRGGRAALLHHDAVGGTWRGTRRARLVAQQCVGAIPDNASYEVVLEPEGTVIGSLDEDFAIESSIGDIFQLGNASWRVLRVQNGAVRVVDAGGAPPTVPFWFGEGPARSPELCVAVDRVRAVHAAAASPVAGVPAPAWQQLGEYLGEAERTLGALPSRTRLIAERFFDESGGMQMVIHSPYGSRINRAWGLALRKRFCRGFGFELQAAAGEDALLISLGLVHSFPLAEVFTYLHPHSVTEVLEQALLDAPVFESRWRWNATTALLVERRRHGKRVPPALVRMRVQDLLTAVFPQVLACFETLPPGDLPIPREHPLIRQTLTDCLHQAMDIEGLIELLDGIHAGSIEIIARDLPQPSVLAQGILNAAPYAFLDDAPLEERRTRAVIQRRGLDARGADEIGALDPLAIERVREEAWPQPASAEEVHEALQWMGYVTLAEAPGWRAWLAELAATGRVIEDQAQASGDESRRRWFAIEASREPREVLRGRLQALGPVHHDDPRLGAELGAELVALEAEGAVLRTRFDGQDGWCDRRLLARIQRYTLDKLRSEIAPVSLQEFWRFLAAWQHATPATRVTGPEGLARVFERLAGVAAPAVAWERELLPLRVERYLPEWLDDLCLHGRVAWGRLWGGARTPVRSTPLSFVPRDELADWLALADPPHLDGLGGATGQVYRLIEAHGALFADDLARRGGLLPSQVEVALAELIARGAVTCDSFSGLRQLLFRRRRPLRAAGRWSLLKPSPPAEAARDATHVPAAERARASHPPEVIEHLARSLLRRTGVVLRPLAHGERWPVPWRDLLRAYRTLELRGEVRGGRFVAAITGEQFALPEAVVALRAARRSQEPWQPLPVPAADPLNLTGTLLPGERIASAVGGQVLVG